MYVENASACAANFLKKKKYLYICMYRLIYMYVNVYIKKERDSDSWMYIQRRSDTHHCYIWGGYD